MDFEFEKEWRATLKRISKDFGEELDMQGILFLIGVQELGKGPAKFRKDEKLNLMHIAVCRLLSSFGYYEFLGRDDQGWPHYENLKKLPALEGKEQESLMKEAIITYSAPDEIFK